MPLQNGKERLCEPGEAPATVRIPGFTPEAGKTFKYVSFGGEDVAEPADVTRYSVRLVPVIRNPTPEPGS